MILKNLREYNQDIFEDKFRLTKLYQTLSKDFAHVVFYKTWENDNLEIYRMSPRQRIGDKNSTVFSAVPFYYLEFLTTNNPSEIYDLGCGWNIFKKYIPNIIGIDSEPTTSRFFHADIHDVVDKVFIEQHQNYFESVFSINALHFRPLSDIKKCVNDFYSMIRPTGTGWLSLNAMRMIELDMEKFGDKNAYYLEKYIRTELAKMDIHYLVVDIDLSTLDEYMNGNVRLVMKK